jgi:hypothetical protein
VLHFFLCWSHVNNNARGLYLLQSHQPLSNVQGSVLLLDNSLKVKTFMGVKDKIWMVVERRVSEEVVKKYNP